MLLAGRLFLLYLLVAPEVAFAGENVWTTNGPPGSVYILAIDPTTLSLYAGTRLGPGRTAVFRSLDRGESWIESAEAPPNTSLTALAVVPTSPQTVYGVTESFQRSSVFRSVDGGSTWALVAPEIMFSAASLTVPSAAPGTLYGAGTLWLCVRPQCFVGLAPTAAMVKSTDSGATWVHLNIGLSGWAVRMIAIDSADPTHLYAGGDAGVFVSADGGNHWASSNTGLGDCLSVTSLAVDPRNSDVVFAGTTWGPSAPYECGGVFQSRDRGQTWTPTSLRSRDVRALLIDPWSPDTLYAGIAGENPIYPDVGVFQSMDGGKTWARVGSELPGIAALVIEPSGRALHAATSAGVYDIEIVPGARPPVIPPRTRAARILPSRP